MTSSPAVCCSPWQERTAPLQGGDAQSGRNGPGCRGWSLPAIPGRRRPTGVHARAWGSPTTSKAGPYRYIAGMQLPRASPAAPPSTLDQ